MDQSSDYTLRAELEQPFTSSDAKNTHERKEDFRRLERSMRSKMIFKSHEEGKCCCVVFILVDIYRQIQVHKLRQT